MKFQGSGNPRFPCAQRRPRLVRKPSKHRHELLKKSDDGYVGGFDVVVGNPPYVRQEWLTPFKTHFEQSYRAYHGMADLYVYFFERGLQLLKPGGRLSFVVTNKWMKAGYGEPLRRLLSESSWVESVVDFGHAKQIFEDADVFPSIFVVRRPTDAVKPKTARLCTIPREQLRVDDLSRQITAEGVALPVTQLGADVWQLEAGGVTSLMAKISRSGKSLSKFTGVKPIYGVKTGCNDAFLIDSMTRDELMRQHPLSEEVLRPYLRGQDVDRWYPEWAGLWMILCRKGFDLEKYPAIKAHLLQFREQLEPKPKDWTGTWKGRASGNHEWFELQTPVANLAAFSRPKIVYQEIQFHSCYAFDDAGFLAIEIDFGDLSEA